MARHDSGGQPAGSGAGARAEIVDAIAHIRRDQLAVESRIGVAFADSAGLRRALRDQAHLLDRAARQIDAAYAAARAAAAVVAADGGDSAAAPYLQAVDGFAAQLRLVRATGAQLERIGAAAEADAERVGRLLRESAVSLDRALRAEIELLARLERLDRERAITRLTRRPRPDASDS